MTQLGVSFFYQLTPELLCPCWHKLINCVLHGVFQAAKPKAASGSEKENNPVRTPEALPEAKKAEYRLLREEIAR